MAAVPHKPRKQPRQQRAVETRERILRAAARVFSEHGYARGTTNRIAEAAGHSIGSLYQYFPNKDAILVELTTAHAEAGIAAVRDLLAGGLPESLEDTLGLFTRAAIDVHRDDPALHRVLFEEAPRPPQLLDLLRRAETELVAATAALLAAHPQARVADAGMAARLTVGAVESLTHRFMTARREAPLTQEEIERFETELVMMLTRYLTAEPADPR